MHAGGTAAALRGARVLVAGGAGFVGSALVRMLAAAGARVVVFDNFVHGRRENLDLADSAAAAGATPVEVVEGDVLDLAALRDAFAKHAPELVFDLVSETFVPAAYDDPERFVRTNVEGTLHLLLTSKAFGVRRVLYASTTEVYGEAEGSLDETRPFAPISTYAATKLAADRLCATFGAEHGLPVVIARLFNGYGPRATHPYVIPEIIQQLAKGRVVRLGNVAARRDFTYVDDLARALAAVILAPLPDGDAVNVGSDVSVSVRELVSILGELMGRGQPQIEIDPARLRRRDVASFRCDPRKVAAATGWRPEVDLRQGLERTIAWFRAHGERWTWESGPEAPASRATASK